MPATMIQRGQDGQTLVELLVGLAVTAIVLGALVGVLYTASDRATRWGDRVNSAANGFTLASALQADAHRYYPCPTKDGLDFRAPLTPAGQSPPVAYRVSRADSSGPGAGWVMTRTEDGRSATVGRLAHQPAFSLADGAIHVSGVLIGIPGHPPQPGDMVVYYRPLGSCAS
jgi:type II secretory pathway component PulJ